jgi:hypothetical protein
MRVIGSIAFVAALAGCALIAAAYAQPALREYIPLGIKLVAGGGLVALIARQLRIASEASSHLKK